MKINQHSQNGFTLLELLIAISIFSALSVMAYGGLKTVLDNKAANEVIANRIAASQLVMLRLGNDFRQTVNRSVRDGFGAAVATMLTQEVGNSELEWTRAGYSNPANLKRSNLQRVAYKLDENKLIRVTWPVLDRAQGAENSEIIMLSEIESLEWRFNDQANNWESNWPPAAVVAANGMDSLPRAVELTITFSDLGVFRRLFLIPQG